MANGSECRATERRAASNPGVTLLLRAACPGGQALVFRTRAEATDGYSPGTDQRPVAIICPAAIENKRAPLAPTATRRLGSAPHSSSTSTIAASLAYATIAGALKANRGSSIRSRNPGCRDRRCRTADASRRRKASRRRSSGSSFPRAHRPRRTSPTKVPTLRSRYGPAMEARCPGARRRASSTIGTCRTR